MHDSSDGEVSSHRHAPAVAASPGAGAAQTNIDFGEIPIATDIAAAAAHSQSIAVADTTCAAGNKPDYVSDELFDDKSDAKREAKEASADGNTASDTTGPSDVAKLPAAPRSPDAIKSDATDASNDAKSSGVKIAQAADQPTFSGVSSVAPSEAARQIDALTRDILLKEIELQRYNLHYTLEVAKQGRWKGWRYATFPEMNAGLGLTRSILSTYNRGRGLHNRKRVDLQTQEAANYVPMIGSIIGASAAAGEFGINAYHEMIAHARGFPPASAVRKVDGLQNNEVRD